MVGELGLETLALSACDLGVGNCRANGLGANAFSLRLFTFASGYCNFTKVLRQSSNILVTTLHFVVNCKVI